MSPNTLYILQVVHQDGATRREFAGMRRVSFKVIVYSQPSIWYVLIYSGGLL